MIDHGAESGFDTSAFPVEGFGAGDAGPPPTIGGAVPMGIHSPLLFVGPRSEWPDAAVIAQVRLANMLPAFCAADYIRQTITLDIVWLAAAETVDAATLAAICDAVEARGCSLICETALFALDHVAAAIPAAVNVQFLVDADPAERMVALAAARRIRHGILHDVARDDAMERIDQLQEEVARISRVLNDLAAQRAALPGTIPGAAPWRGGPADHAGQVRSPPRDFVAAPRGFVIDDHARDRRLAKEVRRMLRQRRMREQFFPADLFADPAWDMLLDLYAAQLERQPVSVSSLCIAAAVPATTALRWIKTMTDAGLFVRQDDPQDGRRIFIALADRAGDALTRYFEALEE